MKKPNNIMKRIRLKRNLFLFYSIVLSISVFSQSSPPESISYQGVARDASGNILSGQPIGIKFIIHQGTTNNPVFSEIHSTTTNAVGIFTLAIGSGSPVLSNFQSINWSQGPYFLEVQMDPAGGTSYTSIGTQQLLSVPYALYSKRSGMADSLNIPPLSISPFWRTKGNYAINPSQHFLGTIDTSSLIFKTNNTKRMSINSQGKVTVGNPSFNGPSLFNVVGTAADTIVAAFTSFNPYATGIAVYNPFPNALAGVILLNNTDTASFAVQPNSSDMYATNNLLVGTNDTLQLTGNNRIEMGSSKNIFMYAQDSVDVLSKVNINYSTPFIGYNHNALTLNFFNSSGFSSALKINQVTNFTNTSLSSHGIYINTIGPGAGKTIGLGTYMNFGGSGEKRGLDVLAMGTGTNIGIFLHTENGTDNWSVYSNKGNVMFRDGHLVSSASNPPILAVTVNTGSLNAYLNTSSTDTKGIINCNIGSTSNGMITVYFAQMYSQPPVVIITTVGDAMVKLISVTQNYFTLSIDNPLTNSIIFDINYMVME